MGGLCSRRATSENTTGRSIPHVNGHFNYGAGTVYQSHRLPPQANNDSMQSPLGESTENQPSEPVFSFPELNAASHGVEMDAINDGIPRLSRALSNKTRPTRSKQVAMAKVSEVSSLLGRAGTAGLGKAVDVLDTLGSSMTNLNLSGGFASSMATKGNKISILSFEVANTIVKGANLMYSLSNENIKHLKEVVLPSEGVQLLISKDMDELFRIAAADKRDELKIFSCEVVRFGNSCKDPQWHNLDRYFEKLESELTPHKQLKEEAETVMLHLMTLVQYTAELYHELHALDRIEQDCRRKAQEEDTSNATQKGDNLAILRAELKSQKKHVKSLKKKSLWSKILEEVMEKLVDIVHFLHLEIHAAFGNSDGDRPIKNNHQRLGSAGLALHYANIITQIDTLVTRSGSVPPNTRDALYQGLPPSIKSALRFKLQSFQLKEELTVQQIKAEMEKTLQWLVPMATNTTKPLTKRSCIGFFFPQLLSILCEKVYVLYPPRLLFSDEDPLPLLLFYRAHHGFGWVGEWANTGKPAGQTDLLRIETLYHADKEKTEAYILELVVWLHYLVTQSRNSTNGGIRSPVKSPSCYPNQKMNQLTHKPSSPSSTLTVEDQEMLRDVSKRKLTPGISKSQEFATARTRLSKFHRLSKSSNHSPIRETRKDPFPVRRLSSVPVIDFNMDRLKALDVIDRVDTIRGT